MAEERRRCPADDIVTRLIESDADGTGDVCIVVCDGLKGLPEAITAVWDRAIVQTCVIHLLRNTFREDPPAQFAVPGLKPGRGWRLRGMATLDEIRGTGAGNALARTALTHAVLAGAATVWCNARTSVAGFYRKHGFHVLGQEFELPGIGPHYFMYWSSR
jgi:ribosomal protein S18 acetylase RimI-like enzyme